QVEHEVDARIGPDLGCDLRAADRLSAERLHLTPDALARTRIGTLDRGAVLGREAERVQLLGTWRPAVALRVDARHLTLHRPVLRELLPVVTGQVEVVLQRDRRAVLRSDEGGLAPFELLLELRFLVGDGLEP